MSPLVTPQIPAGTEYFHITTAQVSRSPLPPCALLGLIRAPITSFILTPSQVVPPPPSHACRGVQQVDLLLAGCSPQITGKIGVCNLSKALAIAGYDVAANNTSHGLKMTVRQPSASACALEVFGLIVSLSHPHPTFQGKHVPSRITAWN